MSQFNGSLLHISGSPRPESCWSDAQTREAQEIRHWALPRQVTELAPMATVDLHLGQTPMSGSGQVILIMDTSGTRSHVDIPQNKDLMWTPNMATKVLLMCVVI